jgi:hypothetical protein
MPRQLLGTAIAANTITTTQLQTTVVTQIESGGGPKAKSLVYPGDDTAANTAGGQTVYLLGSGFAANAQILVNGSAVPSQSFISASNIEFTTPALSTGTYPVYVVNPEDGGTAILYPGLLVSGEPTWVTESSLSEVGTTDAWSISLSATGDAPITYTLANGSSLPSGITLAANGLISGTLSPAPENDTQYTFSVIASDSQNQDSSRQFNITASSGEGLPFANNVLLIHADGTNNKNNHHFIDSSNNNFTITRYGNTTQGTFAPVSLTGWSNYFDGSGDWLQIGNNSAHEFGGSDFTIEFWINFPVQPSSGWESTQILLSKGNDQNGGWVFGIGRDNTVYTWFGKANASDAFSFTYTPIAGVWYHVVYTRSGTAFAAYINGARQYYNASFGSSWPPSSSNDLRIGRMQRDDYPYWTRAHISNFRMVKGSSVYDPSSSTITTPASTLIAVSNTTLLTCHSNRFIDGSNSAFSISRNGDVPVLPYGPFATNVAYSAATVGGSGYFDGSGDYLTVPAGSAFAPGTGDFTIEAWVYPTTNSIDQYIWTQTVSGTNYFLFAMSSTAGLTMTTSGGGTPISGPANSIRPFAWNHVAAVRSGGTVTVYVNGVAGTPSVNAQDLTNTTYVPTIGTYTHSTSSSPLNGYLSSLRYVKGTAVYTTNFTPSATPLTNIANTSFLCNFTNAGIFDHTAKNIIETVGDAKVSTAQYKYGTGSMYFDGTGDFLTIPDNINLRMGTGNFTMEFWWYPVSIAGYQTPLDKGYTGAGALLFQTGNGDGRLIIYAGGSGVITSNTAVSTNTWTHVALVRNSSTMTLYQNGNSVGSVSNSTDFSDATIMGIGSNASGAGGTRFVINGYLDDLRITKGYARYTSNFTAPTAALRDK